MQAATLIPSASCSHAHLEHGQKGLLVALELSVLAHQAQQVICTELSLCGEGTAGAQTLRVVLEPCDAKWQQLTVATVARTTKGKRSQNWSQNKQHVNATNAPSKAQRDFMAARLRFIPSLRIMCSPPCCAGRPAAASLLYMSFREMSACSSVGVHQDTLHVTCRQH